VYPERPSQDCCRYEAIYSGMPLFGLAKAGRLVSAEGERESARGRLGTVTTAPAG
jgi:hypothetical protein